MRQPIHLKGQEVSTTAHRSRTTTLGASQEEHLRLSQEEQAAFQEVDQVVQVAQEVQVVREAIQAREVQVVKVQTAIHQEQMPWTFNGLCTRCHLHAGQRHRQRKETVIRGRRM